MITGLGAAAGLASTPRLAEAASRYRLTETPMIAMDSICTRFLSGQEE